MEYRYGAGVHTYVPYCLLSVLFQACVCGYVATWIVTPALYIRAMSISLCVDVLRGNV